MAFVTLLLEPWQAIKAGCLYFLGKKKHFNFFGLNPRAITADQAKKRPILLIHGNYHNQSGFLPMARYLMRQKIGPVYSVNLPSGGVTDKDYKIIQQKISEIKEQYRQYNVSSTKIDVVGHSRGGLLAHQIAWSSPGEEGRRYWSVCEDIGKVIKIGAVTGGENLYHIEKIDKSFKERLYEITAEHDCLVTARSLLDNSVSICSGHLGLLSSPETLRRVAQILAS
jgi:pimeloyl-ACP methyl ester carboxylesterase